MNRNKFVLLVLLGGLFGTLFLLSRREDSTNETSMGAFKELPKSTQEQFIKNAKNFDREDYYGTWHFYKEYGVDSVEITYKIDEKTLTDLDGNRTVKYKYNYKTHEIYIPKEALEVLIDEEISEGKLFLTFVNGKDKNTLSELGNAVGKDGHNTLFIETFNKIEDEESDQKESSVEEAEIEADISEPVKESSKVKPQTLTKSDIFEIEDNDETYQLITLMKTESQVIEAVLKKNGYSDDDIDNRRYNAFVDKKRNVVVAGIYSKDEQLEKIMMIDIDSKEVLDINVASEKNKQQEQTASSEAFSPNVPTDNDNTPLIGNWKINGIVGEIIVSPYGATYLFGNEKFALDNPKTVNSNTVDYSSNFSINGSANISKVQLEWISYSKAKARFYLDDGRTVTEDLIKNE
ncbi:MAG: hypothetical protein ACLRKW_16655 [Enterococcus avium]